jgi:O-antigen chain-terminating methyltransferase
MTTPHITEAEVQRLVEKLPECYQPIFGFPQLDVGVSRKCEDRLMVIRDSLERLRTHYARPLRVLDFGCAQGFFSMSIADLCDSVLGIDYLPANIDVCNAARDAGGLSHVQFQVGDISNVIETLEAGRFDVVFGLSVFHHLCHAQGWQVIADQLKTLAAKVDVLILELADAREPLYWAPSLPADAAALVQKIGFIYPLDAFPTHLGDVERVLYFCSDRIWQCGSSVAKFTRWTEKSHEFAGMVHQGTRRYFFGDDAIAKTIRFMGQVEEHNRREFEHEVNFYNVLAPALGSTFESPHLLSAGSGHGFAHIVATRIPGRPLSELMTRGEAFDAGKVIRCVLDQLVHLEAQSLYHRDVRAWNVLIDDFGQARLIDFAAIGPEPGDDVWPFDGFLSFLIFVNEIAMKTVPRVHLFRRPMLSSAWVQEPFRSWLDAIWAEPYANWSFAQLRDLLNAGAAGRPASVGGMHPTNWWLWSGALERLASDASDAFRLQLEAIDARASREDIWNMERQLNDVRLSADTRINELLTQISRNDAAHSVALEDLHQQVIKLGQVVTHEHDENAKLVELLRAKEREYAELQSRNAELQAVVAETRNTLNVLQNSLTWRLGRPLRMFSALLRSK